MPDNAPSTPVASDDLATVNVDGSVPLLALKPADTEKAGENFPVEVEATRSPPLTPLLGTIASYSVEISRGSSKKRSPESICYPQLLRENGPSSGRKFRKTAPVEDRVAGRETGTGD
ncbi:hypothetical protein [Sphingomonas yabuuchiae]|uniref:hypothetical protein n=1 Tax=Sphingomonas yabuuchiae TaxID=172044 RepID=UPI003D96ABCA